MGNLKEGTPQEPSILAGAMVQGGSDESVVKPARLERNGRAFGLSREAPSYIEGAAGGNDLPLENGPHAHALLGNKGRTAASHASRGFQPISVGRNGTLLSLSGAVQFEAQRRAFAIFTMGYPVGVLSSKAVEFDLEAYRVDPIGYLDTIEAGLPEGAYLVRVERYPWGGRL